MWTTMINNLLGKTFLSCSFCLYRFRKYVSYSFPIINFCNPGAHYETPSIKQTRLAFKGHSRIIRLQWSHGSNQSSVCGHIVRLVKVKLHLRISLWNNRCSGDLLRNELPRRCVYCCPQWRTDVTCNTGGVRQGPVTISLLGEAAKLWKSAVTFVTSVRPHGKKSAPTKRIFMEFDTWVFFRKSAEKIHVLLKSDKNNEYMKIYVHLR